jgi:hypothetical protein
VSGVPRPAGDPGLWATDPNAVVQPPTTAETLRGEVPGQPLPAGRLNSLLQWIGNYSRMTGAIGSPTGSDTAFGAPLYGLRVENGDPLDPADGRGVLSAFVNGIRLSVINTATQWIEFSGRLEPSQSSGQAFSVGGVTYGYGAGGSVCRYAIPGATAAVRSLAGRTLDGASVQNGGAVYVDVPTGPDRGPAPGTTPNGFYAIGSQIDVYVTVSGSAVDATVTLSRIGALGLGPSTVATQSFTSLGPGAEILALSIAAPDRALSTADGSQYVIEVACTGGSGTLQVNTVEFSIRKRGIE